MSIGIGKAQIEDSINQSQLGAAFFTAVPRGWIKNGNSSSAASQGVIGEPQVNITSAGTSAQVAANYPEPAVLNISTGAVGSVNYFGVGEVFANPQNFIWGRFRRFQARMSLGNVLLIRSWVGIGNPQAGFGGQFWANDAPGIAGGSLAAFRFSRNAGDQTWKCVTQQTPGGLASQTIVDSGVAPGIGLSHLMEILFDGFTVIFKIDGKVVGFSKRLPANNDNMLAAMTVDNINAANNVSINAAYFLINEAI